ncbi:MAG: sporulation-control protein spo0M [Cognaticolwellia sp.]|jgi:sporulation-control protein spo0M
MKIKQVATITSINDLNKSFEVKTTEFHNFSFTLTIESDNELLLPMTKGKLGNYLDVGGEIKF